ncbi:MAG TPA: hypothetical protein VGH91_11135 [Gammaproteobacteria bacterium]
MILSSHKTGAPAAPSLDQGTQIDLKFTQTGKYLIAAGSERQEGRESFTPVLYISLVGDKSWAIRYPVAGKFAKDEEAAAAALHYAIQIITRQIRDVARPGDPHLSAV